MKNYLLLIALCLFANLANAQDSVKGQMRKEDMFPKNAKYFIKGGEAEIPYAKLDSVIMNWGGRFQMEKSTEGNEQRIYLVKFDSSKMNSKIKQQQERMDQSNEMMEKEMAGKTAAPFELTDINGKKYALQDLKGKVVVLNFWFTACVPCQREMPELNKLTEKYKGKNVVFLAIGNDNPEQIKEFLKTNTFNYTLLSSGIKTARDYNVAFYPTSMVIDKSGVIKYSKIGGENVAEFLSKEIDKQL